MLDCVLFCLWVWVGGESANEAGESFGGGGGGAFARRQWRRRELSGGSSRSRSLRRRARAPQVGAFGARDRSPAVRAPAPTTCGNERERRNFCSDENSKVVFFDQSRSLQARRRALLFARARGQTSEGDTRARHALSRAWPPGPQSGGSPLFSPKKRRSLDGKREREKSNNGVPRAPRAHRGARRASTPCLSASPSPARRTARAGDGQCGETRTVSSRLGHTLSRRRRPPPPVRALSTATTHPRSGAQSRSSGWRGTAPA